MVVGDREVMTIEHFSPLKKALQRLGSWVVRRASQTDGARHHLRLPRLQPRGRARDAGRLEVHVHARDDHPGRQDADRGRPRPGRAPTRRRASRGCSRRCGPTSAATACRSSASTRCTSRCGCSCSARSSSGSPRSSCGGASSTSTSSPSDGSGHVQSLILGAVLFNAAMLLAALGIIGDLLSGQRIMLQRTFERVRRIELELGVAAVALRAGRAPDRPRGRPPARTPAAAAAPRSARRCKAMSTVTRDAEGTVTGNTYDKYGSTNPVVRRLMARLRAHARRAVRRRPTRSRCSTSAAARRCSPTSGRSGWRRGASSASTSRTR